MILLDPDLDPDPALAATAAKQPAVSGPLTPNKNLSLPSARTLANFLAEAQAAVRLKGEVTVLLTTDAEIRKLNRQFRGKNQATDVLSFPAEGIGAEEYAGDLAISVRTARKQAAEQGHSLSTEIKVLILHGLLHLAGYNHEADEGRMARREGMLRAKLGLQQGLIERVAASGKHPSRAKDRKFASQHSGDPTPPAPSGERETPQGLKPDIPVGGVSARLKSCPDTKRPSTPARLKSCSFKAGTNEVRGIPPLPQKQVRGKDGAPSSVGTADTKRGPRRVPQVPISGHGKPRTSTRRRGVRP